MKRFLLLTFAVFAIRSIFAQGICNDAGNIIIYSNYDGGELNINVDENVPNIQIGICTYASVNVTISGTYASNVTKVTYAGYDDFGSTSVTGVDDAIVDILLYPEVTLEDPDGNVHMICAYECDTDYIPGGCNTVDQLTDYFLTYLDGSLRYSFLQYGVFGTGTYNISDGGNCCVGEIACIAAVDAGQDEDICLGESVVLDVTGASEYTWSPAVSCDPPCESAIVNPITTTTYYITGTDDEGCIGIDSVTVTVNPVPTASLSESGDTLYAEGGTVYTWLLDGSVIADATGNSYVPLESGSYSVIVANTAGCSDTSDAISMVIQSIRNETFATALLFYPNPVFENCTITIQNVVSGTIQCMITNSIGEVMSTNIFIKTSFNQSFVLNTENLPSGIYTVYLTNEKFCSTGKLVVMQ